MPSIDTLIPDIYSLLKTKGWFTDELRADLSREITTTLQTQFTERTGPSTLRLSRMGPVCPKALWHSVHTPELAEPLPPWVEFKFTYGHILEALVLALAKAAGHSVVGEQDELILDGVVGHRDCVLDGFITDVKSCSSRMFEKFKHKTIAQDDPFGYLDQLDGYAVASSGDPLVQNYEIAYIFAIDKTLGHMCLYEHTVRPERIRARVREALEIVQRIQPPECECGTQQMGASGNICLDTRASYSAYKSICFPHLRTFRYASGPVYLTKVVRVPDVPEITRHQAFHS